MDRGVTVIVAEPILVGDKLAQVQADLRHGLIRQRARVEPDRDA